MTLNLYLITKNYILYAKLRKKTLLLKLKFLKQNIEHREEGGTPAIVESIRAGLAMQLKMSVSTEYIMSRESILMSKARARLNSLQNVRLLGNMDLPRLPVLSIIIEHEETGGFLHHNFVCALLNDLFGIQVSIGCIAAVYDS